MDRARPPVRLDPRHPVRAGARHGVGLSCFAPIAPLLAEHGPVHVLELPGFGDAPKPPEVLTVEQHAGLVVALLRSIGRPASRSAA